MGEQKISTFRYRYPISQERESFISGGEGIWFLTELFIRTLPQWTGAAHLVYVLHMVLQHHDALLEESRHRLKISRPFLPTSYKNRMINERTEDF
jgi:hypothetical protein